jgi:hypothetical protein
MLFVHSKGDTHEKEIGQCTPVWFVQIIKEVHIFQELWVVVCLLQIRFYQRQLSRTTEEERRVPKRAEQVRI